MIFNYLYEAYKSGTLFSNESPMLYICSECGYMHTGTKAWDVCPLCKSSQGYVELHLPFEKERIWRKLMKTSQKTQSPKAAALRAQAAVQKTASKRSFYSHDDPSGSYTGVPSDGGVPVQDADDL